MATTTAERRNEIRDATDKRLLGEVEFDRGTTFSDVEAVIDSINGTDGDLAAELGPGNGVVFIIELTGDIVIDKECTCGARLTGLEDVDFLTVPAPTPGPGPGQTREPDAECSQCGGSIGAMFGGDTVLRLYTVSDEQLPGTGD